VSSNTARRGDFSAGFVSAGFVSAGFALDQSTAAVRDQVETTTHTNRLAREIDVTPRQRVDLAGPDTGVTCEHPQCAKPPVLDGLRLSRINDALNRMRSKGGVCATLAALGDTLLTLPNGGIRIYSRKTDTAFSKFGGGAIPGGATPASGGAKGPKSWLVIQAEWTDLFYDASHKTTQTKNGETFTRDLQQTLAHELDHLYGSTPAHTDAAGAKTPNSETCSDF